jgi:hypothetical protein
VDDNEITEGLRGIALAEPPLGFNPDDLATRAARRQRDRRVAVGTGVAVTTVAVAAVAFSVNATGRNEVSPGSSSPSSGPATTTVDHELTAERARNRQHLQRVLPGLLPGARQIKVSEFDQADYGQPNDWAYTIGDVRFRDDAGEAYFTIAISGPEAPLEPLAKQCDPTPVDENGKPVEVPVLPNGKPLQCKKVPQSDGSTVVIQQSGSPIGDDLTSNVVRVAGVDASHYRTDGSSVTVGLDRWDRPRDAMTEQQLITLVTDPELTLD